MSLNAWNVAVVMVIGVVSIPGTATADSQCFGVDDVYVGHDEHTYDRCDGRDLNQTEVYASFLVDYAYFRGGHSCGESTTSGMILSAPFVTVAWGEHSNPDYYDCWMVVFFPGGHKTVDCLIPPPNPGWGTLP